MRKPLVPIAIGLALAAGAACSDSANSRLLAPGALSAWKGSSSDQGGNKDDGKSKSDDDKTKKDDDNKDGDKDKVSICHAAGRIGTTHYVLITVGAPARYAHIDDHGTPMAGHEEDYYATDDDKKNNSCGGQSSITKSLVDVMTLDAAGNMIHDPVFTGGEVTVPEGQTRWLDFKITYTLPTGVTGTVTENQTTVCSTLGAADLYPVGKKIDCSINVGGSTPPGTRVGGGVVSWGPFSTSSSMIVPIDIYYNGGICGRRTLTNTVVLTLSNGQTKTAVATTVINFVDKNGQPCDNSTITKSLVDVMTLDAAGNMIHDPAFTGGEVTVPEGQTRWLDFKIAYTLPGGVNGTITENQTTVCSTLGAADLYPVGTKIDCSINVGGSTPAGTRIGNGVVSWGPFSAGGSMIVPIDIYYNGGICGRRTLTNTVVLTLANGQTRTASASTVINFVSRSCP